MIDKLLSRLDKVKSTSRHSWLACCPSHDDKTPSMTISDRDGRILIHCFAGCPTESIIETLGLEWNDLMPESFLGEHRPEKVKVYPADALRAIRFEAMLVCVAAIDMSKGQSLTAEDKNRLLKAMERINSALELANVS